MHIVYNFTLEDTRHISANYQKWKNKDFHETDKEAVASFVEKNSLLSDPLKKELEIFSKSPFCEYVLIRGVDVDVPDAGYEKPKYESELFLASIAYLLGSPVSNIHHKNGRIVHDIYPKAEDKDKQVGSNAEQFLFWHTENAHEDPLPSCLALFCLRGDSNAKTLLANLYKAPLSVEEQEMLKRKTHVISADLSYAADEEGQYAIYTEANGGPCYRFDPLYTTAENDKAKHALDSMVSHCNDNSFGVTLEKGDVLLINNRLCCHARTLFKSNYDGKDRWIQRVIINS